MPWDLTYNSWVCDRKALFPKLKQLCMDTYSHTCTGEGSPTLWAKLGKVACCAVFYKSTDVEPWFWIRGDFLPQGSGGNISGDIFWFCSLGKWSYWYLMSGGQGCCCRVSLLRIIQPKMSGVSTRFEKSSVEGLWATWGNNLLICDVVTPPPLPNMVRGTCV